MEIQTRPFITATVVVLGAGLISIGPAAPAPPSIATPAVQLAANSDLIALWAEVFDRALTNVTALGTDLVTPPLPVLQQTIVNQVGFLQDFLANPSDIWNIVGQMWDNLVTRVSVPFETDTSLLDNGHRLVFATVYNLLPHIAPDNTELAERLLDFTATPFSGWLFGELGTVLSPLLELRDSINAIVEAIGAGEWGQAWDALLATPAHMTDGWLNGYGTVDLMGVLGPYLPELPIGTIRDLNVDLGGLLSGGGLMFGGIGADVCTTVPIAGCVSVPPFPIEGTGSGPWGSLIDLSQIVAQALGWDGTGNPIDVLIGDVD